MARWKTGCPRVGRVAFELLVRFESDGRGDQNGAVPGESSVANESAGRLVKALSRADTRNA